MSTIITVVALFSVLSANALLLLERVQCSFDRKACFILAALALSMSVSLVVAHWAFGRSRRGS